jgi:hypothetical protein
MQVPARTSNPSAGHRRRYRTGGTIRPPAVALQSLTSLLGHDPSPGRPPTTPPRRRPGAGGGGEPVNARRRRLTAALRGSSRRQLTVARFALDDLPGPHPWPPASNRPWSCWPSGRLAPSWSRPSWPACAPMPPTTRRTRWWSGANTRRPGSRIIRWTAATVGELANPAGGEFLAWDGLEACLPQRCARPRSGEPGCASSSTRWRTPGCRPQPGPPPWPASPATAATSECGRPRGQADSPRAVAHTERSWRTAERDHGAGGQPLRGCGLANARDHRPHQERLPTLPAVQTGCWTASTSERATTPGGPPSPPGAVTRDRAGT